jgi:predicted nucleotidyltransferase
MISAIAKDLDLIRNSIIANTKAEHIYLFGSYANGSSNANSDIDIYLVIPDNDADIIELGAKIRNDLYKKKSKSMDLLISKKSVFDKRKNNLSLENIIAKEGISIL